MGEQPDGDLSGFFRRLCRANQRPNVCPRCGKTLEARSSMHYSGYDEDGRRWTGGAEWAYCAGCDQWYEVVYSPFLPRPDGWKSCEPPAWPDLAEAADGPPPPGPSPSSEPKEVPANLHELPVGALGLMSFRTRNLENEGIRTIGQLLERSVDDLLGLHGFGYHCRSEIRQKLAAYNLRLRGEDG